MKNQFATVDEYLAAQPEAAQGALRRVRTAIRKALPNSKEIISYQMPAYERNGQRVIFFAGWKRHYSLYPASARLVAAFKNQLEPYQVSKGTIRFPLSQPVPAGLIVRIAKFRAQETSASRQTSARRKNAG